MHAPAGKTSRVTRLTTGLLLGAAVWFGYGEASHWVASRRRPGRTARPGGSLGVLVLGYPCRPDGRASRLQQWRVDIAARTVARHTGGPVHVLFSGGQSRPGCPSEARVMQADAVARHGLDARVLELEEGARTTWENIALGLPRLAGCDQIAVASNALHAWRARGYVAQQFPELLPRLVFAADYRFGEQPLVKAPFAWYESALGVKYAIRDARARRR